jgi:D-3-phosphoglycerate dehydrogenase
LLPVADVLSLHRPLRSDTRHTLDAARLAAMKSTAIVVNTARGALIDEVALAEALRERRIAGAGLDVFTSEPLPGESPLAGLDNIVLGPHTAGSTEDALRRTAEQCADQIIAVLNGVEPANLFNPAVWPRRRLPAGGTA